MTDIFVETLASPAPTLHVGHRTTCIHGVAALGEDRVARSNEHDRVSRAVLLDRVAALLGVPVVSPARCDAGLARDILLVPGETIDRKTADSVGLSSRHCILGGVVPATFVGTKAITHGLVDANAARPALWSPLMAERVASCVLRGYTAFSHADAMRAGRILLADGRVRVKEVCGKAGLGQTVVHNEAQLAAVLAAEAPEALALCGVVLEEDLADVVTYSVGVTELGSETISYWGRQNLTRDHQGREVYGGSDLFVVRGDLDALVRHNLQGVLSEVVRSAALFDEAAQRAYPDAMLTRRNYDVIEGTDQRGAHRIGVLEQSWRVGGASGAEIAAFEAFRAEPDTDAVRCSTVEIYDAAIPPAGATVYYMGDDPEVGTMTKFAVRLG